MSVIIASRRHFKEKPDIARRFLMAIVEGAHLARTRKELALRTPGRRLNPNSTVASDRGAILEEGRHPDVRFQSLVRF